MKNKIYFIGLFLVLLGFSMSFAYDGTEPPKPDEKGNYNIRGLWYYWKVVDPDPAGLNGRLAQDFPMYWFSPDSKWSENNIGNWPVIRRFKKGTVLKANGTPAGFISNNDKKGDPWIRINIGAQGDNIEDGEYICFVRANSKYIKPVTMKNSPPQSLGVAVIKDPDGYTNIRSGPDSNASIIDKVYNHEHFLILSDHGQWRRVLSPEGKQGYIHESRIEIIRKDGVGAAVVSDPDGYTNLRIGPSTDFPVTDKINSGNRIMLLTPDPSFDFTPGPWLKVMTTGGKTGYMSTTRMKWIPLCKY